MGSAGRFLASGGFNTLVTYLAYLALLHWLPYRTSYSIAFASGIALAYVLNRYYVFRQGGGALGPVYVALIYGAQNLLGLAIVSAWVGWIGGPARLAPLVAVAISLPLTYLCNAAVFGSRPGAGSGIRPDQARLLLKRVGVAVLVGLPLLSLALNAIGWLQFGFDLPFYDDWRAYATGQIDSLDPAYLFMGINDTMAPVGFALDAIAQRTLDGNSVVYQFLSMVTVLGLLLLLQWKLLNAALGNRLLAAGCFVFTLLMLQPGSYWGRENLAYHQALPLVFLLAALWLIAASQWRDRWRLPAILGLGLLAGMTYISGAFGVLAAAAGVLAVAFAALPAGRRTRIVRGAVALGVAGLVTSVTQFKVGVLPTMGATHRGDARLALPHEPDFWLFLFGKVGRSLLLPESHALRSLAVVLVACAIVLGLGVLLLQRLRADPDGPYLRLAVVYGGLVATVFMYLLLVAAGRTYLRGPEVKSALDVFLLGFSRFHFFWAALLWPWVAAAALALARGRRLSLTRRDSLAAGFVGTAGVVLMLWGGALDHLTRHRMEAWFRNATVTCLMSQLQKGEGIDCQEFNMPDLTPAYIYARRIGASFVRYFPVLPVELGVDDPAPWFRLSRDRNHVETRNVSPAPMGYAAAPDAQFEIRIGRPEEMGNCVMLDVKAVVNASQDDILQLFFQPHGQAGFTEASSRSLPVKGGAGKKEFEFRLESDTGFGDALRLDPVNKAQDFSMPEVEVRCRLRYSTRPFFSLSQPPQHGQVVDSAWLDPLPNPPGAYRAGKGAFVTLRTDKPLAMAQCSGLDVQVKLGVQQDGRARIYFMRRGQRAFTQQQSAQLAVGPVLDGQPQPLVFRLESENGFEDKLRFDPVDSAQTVRISDLNVRCRRRLASTGAKPVPVAASEKSTQS